ncbi:putative repeat protein (TIGR02543 family) [Fontibacillus phaseoli]|uniref:Putative repeat protein (TIGR02543 family) n=1 Tax=Fontibacillus phaseoli TaxID=1416533 RepID=A0A369B9E7_9BACL|nr:S-layer homology domain-containing protein [Fontibacillus phaseoli]RCX18159.1 putative repeat protein (TIGR02543 family) [Fontibacillus phaseoli]
MNLRFRTKAKMTSMVLALTLVLTSFPLYVQAGDTWPFQGESAHGENQPSVHGYTSGQVLDWSPNSDPDAELLRSRVPLQKRIHPLTATQSNPNLDPNVKMITVAGDYGNAFIENAPYTNKFAQYHFNFWQYIDYYSYWHGTATAYTPSEYYDDLAQKDWQQKWFEFGMLNIPNPTYTDAAHKNGVLSLAGIFFSNNDRGQQTYKQMILKDEQGNYPVAEKLIEMADYFGYDGYFVNQEEVGPNVEVKDIPDYIGFMKALQKGGLYVQWYDSLNTATGSNTFARTFNDNNISFLYDKNSGERVSQSYFFDYGMRSSQINSAKNYLNNLNQTSGADLDIFDVGFAGLEAGRDRFKSVQGTALRDKLVDGLPSLSIATLGADFVHAGLDEDMNQSWPVRHRAENNYQWMTKVREQLWWSGPNIDPRNTAVSPTNTAADVYADNRYWPGISSVIAERSVIGDANFYSNFNTGHGLSYYVNGSVSNDDEWSNMSLQDIPVTWQWWQDTTGNKLTVDFDYGPKYNIADTTRYNYEQIGAYQGGSSLVVNGDLNAETFLRLYKTDLNVNEGSKLSITYNKSSDDDGSGMQIGLIMADDPSTVQKVPVPDSGKKSNGWVTSELDLSQFAGKSIAAFGLVFEPGQTAVNGYQMNIGQIRIFDGSAVAPTAPAGLTISEIHPNSDEVMLKWNLDSDYSKVKQYNVYVNDVYVGGKYDEVFYVKNLPAKSGTIKVAAVGADGQEGTAASLPFDLNASVSNIAANSQENGDFEVSWVNPPDASGDISVSVKSLNRITTDQPVNAQLTVPAGATSAVFSGMPINGDDYLVTVAPGGAQPVMLSGNFIDKISEPYAEAWSWEGNQLKLPMPNTRDWRYMYVYEDGISKSFPVTYISNKTEAKIIRGRTTKASLAFTSNAQNVYVVMEDNAGNKSTPVYLKGKERYKIEFDANGGEPAIPPIEAAYGAKIAEPMKISKEGYVFDGWYHDQLKWDFNQDTVKTDLKLTAKWKFENPVVQIAKEGTFREGTMAALKAVASGKGTLSYAWYEDSGNGYSDISVTEATYAIPQVALEMDGVKYKVVVTNEEGGIAEAETTVNVIPAEAEPVAPGFEINLEESKTVNENEAVTLLVSPTGDVESMVWEAKRKDSENWTQVGENSSIYSFTARAEDDGTVFRAVLRGIEGTNPATATSTELTLTVKPDVVAAYPEIQSVSVSKNPAEPGDEVIFTVEAAGSGTLSYQWMKDGNPVSEATGAVFTLNQAAKSDEGKYKVAVTNTYMFNGKEYTAVQESEEISLKVGSDTTAEWNRLESLLNEIDALRDNAVYTAGSIAELRSSKVYTEAKALSEDSPLEVIKESYANLLQAKRSILVVYVPVSPGPGSGSNSGSGGSGTVITPAPTPAPIDPGTMAISANELSKPGKDGITTIEVKSTATSIELPVNAGELLKQNQLRIQADKLALEISPKVLLQLQDLLGEKSPSGSKIRIGIQAKSISEAGVTTRSGVSLQGSAVEVEIRTISADGTVHPLTAPVEPLKLMLPLQDGLNAELSGIYIIGNNGSLTYLGGTLNGNRMELEVHETGIFGLLEYKANFQDVSGSHWAANAIQRLAAKHWIQGVSDNRYEPNRTITRAEFVKIVASALNLKEKTTLKFNDVPSGSWYEEDLAKMAKAGLISGRSADRFEPNANISRQEIVTLLMRAYTMQHDVGETESGPLQFSDGSSIAPWALESVKEAAALGLVQGQGERFAPDLPATRAEAAQFVLNFLIK